MKSVIFGLLAAFVSLTASAHDHPDTPGMVHLMFSNGAIHAHCTWKQGPQLMNESILEIDWKNGATHTPIDPPGAFAVSIDMPEMPMNNPPTQITRVVDAQGAAVLGSYLVQSIYFTMGGKWNVNVTLKYADGTQETQPIALDIPDTMGTMH